MPAPITSRRAFLSQALTVAAAPMLLDQVVRAADTVAAAVSSPFYAIKRIDRTTVRLPFRPTPDRNMAREIPHWAWSEVCQVELASGKVGVGETLLYYTWGVTGDKEVQRALGRNAVELMWDDSLGAGLQIALFDAVARTVEVPIHALFGQQVHQQTPVAWWNIDTSVEDMVSECQAAHRQGYRSYKTKGRPWFDVWRQVESVAAALPESFTLAIDFNDTLLDADRGIPILKELERHPQCRIWESPIFQTDIPGNQRIRAECQGKVAMHYGSPQPLDALRERVCDGFVVGGGASRLVAQAHVAEMADLPFWLQLVGTGITAAWSVQLGGAFRQATWPAVNCHQLRDVHLLTEPIRVTDGLTAVPDRPGLGYELDRDAVAKYRVEKPAARPDPRRLVEVRWPDGRQMYLANTEVNFVLNAARSAKMPYFERGVDTRLWPDDGSERFRELYQRALQGPVSLR